MRRTITCLVSVVVFCVLSTAQKPGGGPGVQPPVIRVDAMTPITTIPVTSGMTAEAVVTFNVPAIGMSPADLFWTGPSTLTTAGLFAWTPDNTTLPSVRRSMKLNGTNSSFAIRTAATMPLSTFTIEFWLKGTAQGGPHSTGLNDDGGGLFSYAVSGTTNELLIFGQGTSTEGEIVVWLNGNAFPIPFRTPTLFDNQWHHLMVRRKVVIINEPHYHAVKWGLEVFVDGVASINNFPFGTYPETWDVWAESIASGGTLVLGQDQDNYSSTITGDHGFEGDQNWGGYIDDVRVWGSIVNPDVRGKLFPLGTPNLYHQWRFDEWQNLNYGGGGADDVRDFASPGSPPMDTALATLTSTDVPSCADNWLVSALVGPGTGGIGLSILANGNIHGTNGALFSVPSPMHYIFVYDGSGAPPTASLATPEAGPTSGGTLVTLTGERMSLLTFLTVDSLPIAFTVIDDEHVSFVTPPHATGTPDIVLGSPIGTNHFFGFTYGARTLLVPNQYASIALAVSASFSGDIIEISPRVGNYHEHGIDLGGRSLVIRGNGERDRIIIDGDHLGVIFYSQPDPSSAGVRFENLTFLDGDSGSDPTVGGSISATISSGYANATPFVVRNCRFSQSTGIRGAAISVTGGKPAIEDCVFEDCTFSADGSGGVVYLELTTAAVISECIFAMNGTGTNPLNEYGAIYAAQNTDLKIRSSTIVDNRGALCGGIGLEQNVSPLVTHCIIRDNYQPAQVASVGDTSLQVTSCNLNGPVPGVSVNNINENPLFRDRTARDFHLTTLSPCVDAGATTISGLATRDMDGEPRRIALDDLRVDIGADEYLRGPYCGSEEDLWVDVFLNGQPITGTPAQVQVVDVQEGDQLVLHFGSRHGTFVGSIPLIAGQPFELASPPTSLTATVHLDPYFDPPPFLIYWGAVVPTPFGAITAPLSEEGITLMTTVPVWMPGNAILVQALAITSTAQNGFFASTDGVRLQHP